MDCILQDTHYIVVTKEIVTKDTIIGAREVGRKCDGKEWYNYLLLDGVENMKNEVLDA